jgi:hypothetical protein
MSKRMAVRLTLALGGIFALFFAGGAPFFVRK